MRRTTTCSGVLLAVLLGACSSPSTTESSGGGAAANGSGPSGKLYYASPESGSPVYEYAFATTSSTRLFEECEWPSARGSDVLCIDPSDALKGFDPLNVYLTDRTGVQRTKVIATDENSSDGVGGTKLSPDGSKFALFNYAQPGLEPTEATHVYDRGGALLKTIPGLFHPAWTPDGRIVGTGSVLLPYFDGPRTPTADGLYITDKQLENPQRIDTGLTNPLHPAVSPDGSRIAFDVQQHIWTIKLDGTGLQQITTGNKQESHPVWSPDGESIACVSYGTFETSSFAVVAVVPAEVSSPTELTNDADVWPREKDTSGSAMGRLNAWASLSWVP